MGFNKHISFEKCTRWEDFNARPDGKIDCRLSETSVISFRCNFSNYV